MQYDNNNQIFHFFANWKSSGFCSVWLTCCLLVLLLYGCGLDEMPEEDSGNPDPATDGDAGPGSDNEYTPSSSQLGVILTPPTDSGLLAQQKIIYENTPFVTLTMKPSYTYSGEVQQADGEPTEATLSFVPPTVDNKIPGIPLQTLSIQTNVLEEDVDKASFALALIPGTYTLYVFPKNDALAVPIARHNGLNISQDHVEILKFEKGQILEGKLVNATGSGLKAKIVAYDTNSWKRSTVATSNSNGEFDLTVSEASGTYQLSVSSAEDGPILPTLTVPDAFSITSTQVQLSETNASGRLLITYEAFSGSTCTLTGMIRSSAFSINNPVGEANARLLFKSNIGGGIFETTATSDENGLFSVELIQTRPDTETYSLVIVPEINSGSRIYRQYDITCDKTTETLEPTLLEKRLLLSGTLTDYTGKAIPGMEVHAIKQPTTSDLIVYTKQAFTGADGQYHLSLDPGTYTLQFIPPESSGLGRSQLTGIQTSTNGVIDQTLYPGSRFTGQVLDASGNPVPWTTVDIFRIRPAQDTAELIGTGTSIENGSFDILIP